MTTVRACGFVRRTSSKIVPPLPPVLRRARPVVGHVHVVAEVGQDIRQVAARVHVIVHDEDGTSFRAHPRPSYSRTAVSRTVNALPRPRVLATRRLPLFF